MLDDFNREGLSIEGAFSLPTGWVVHALEQIIEWRGKLKRLRCDNSPAYISAKRATWAKKHQIELIFIQPDKPQQNAYNEHYNRTVGYD